jgi:ferredoxin
MPGGDRTRPVGLGPRSGRSAGDSAGRPVPAYLNLLQRLGFWGWGRGRGTRRGNRGGGGRRAGKGRGRGRGTGRGRGMMASSWAAPPPETGSGEVSAPTTPPPPPSQRRNDQELEALKAQARATEQTLRPIHEKASQRQAGARPRSSLVAVVDTARCTGCGACAAICPMGAIAVDAAASIETFRCAGCGLCVDECPQEAITLKRI